MEEILKIRNICKNYKSNQVLKNVSMTIYEGDIYGFVGKNGAGKTTLIRIIAGLTYADNGEFELFGENSKTGNIDLARRKICTMVEAPAIYPDLTALENMKMQCIITKKSTNCIEELLKFVGLDKTEKKKAKDFSLGMRQRLGIAMALVSEPKLMLLDEPINGLDPEGIKQVRDLLLKMHLERKVTILISSHILTELSLFATRYGFIDKGHIIKEATLDEIEKATSEGCYIECNDIKKAREVLAKMGYGVSFYNDGLIIDNDIDLMRVCSQFQKEQINLTKHIRNNLDLESYFMSLINH